MKMKQQKLHARSVASSSSLTKASSDQAAVYGRDPNWGRIACATSYAGIPFNPNKLCISLGEILLMDGGQPLSFDSVAASNYMRNAGETHGTVEVHISIGDGPGSGVAWCCHLWSSGIKPFPLYGRWWVRRLKVVMNRYCY